MIFTTTLSQMAFLFSLMVIGYILAKFNFVPDNSERVLSKLENFIFIPALVLGTFIENFTTESLSGAKNLIIGGIIALLIVIPIAMLCARLCTKDSYIKKIYLYGLCFSNFAFMGNAIAATLFPDIFLEYIIYTMVLWTGIYVWGAPALLMGDDNSKKTMGARLKNLINPMFVCMAIGMVIGLARIPVPGFAMNVVDSLKACMSPVAMLLSGMTIARYNMKEILGYKSVYAVTGFRLLVFPLLFLAFAYFVPMDKTFVICTMVALAMPMGLNTIVIPGAYGKDTRIASSMAVVSHILGCITIPIIFALMSNVLGI